MITSIRSLATERARRREARIRQLEQERDSRESAIFQRIPRLAEIKALQSEVGLDLARLMLRVPTRFNKSFEELQAWSLELSAERRALLERHRINPDELDVRWDCPICKNTGWLQPEVAGPDTVHPAKKCQCLIQEEIDDLYRAAGIAGHMREQTFGRFDLTVYPSEDRDYMAKVVEYGKGYASRVAKGTQEESLLLTGDVGRGKTFLSTAIGNVAVEAHRTVVYFTFSEFLDLLRLHKFEDEEKYREGLQRLLDADLIILDDLGAEKVTEFVAQELFNIINHRMNRSMPMIVSTNLTPQELADAYGPRIASRLLNGFEVLLLRGDDIRWILRRRRAHQ
ncbi:MAG: putative chromosome replication initiation protein [Firmicutes bacterium]|nr:putative chromosome replication initiation protein [Bacillota bacterium]